MKTIRLLLAICSYKLVFCISFPDHFFFEGGDYLKSFLQYRQHSQWKLKYLIPFSYLLPKKKAEEQLY